MKNIFNNKIKLIVGMAAIAATVIIGIATGCSYESNAAMSVVAGFGVLSLLCALFSKIYKTNIPYIPYMAGHIAGLIIYLYIISKYEAIGSLYMILFCIVLFLAIFIFDICIVKTESVARRIIYALIMNIVVHICIFIAIAAVVTVSVIVVGV